MKGFFIRNERVASPFPEVPPQGGGDTGATLRRLIRQVPPWRRTVWVMDAAVRMVIGADGSTISRIECTTASSGPSPGSATGFRVRCSEAGPSAAQIGPTEASSAAEPAWVPWVPSSTASSVNRSA